MINYDLENSPLLIKTDSELGSGDMVSVDFYTAEGNLAGGVHLLFTSSLKYWLSLCSGSFTDLPTDLPQEKNKVWKITSTRNPGATRLVITCNNEEVLNVVLSDTTCTKSSWSTFWSRDVVKIRFSSGDKASLQTRYNHMDCFHGNLELYQWRSTNSAITNVPIVCRSSWARILFAFLKYQ